MTGMSGRTLHEISQHAGTVYPEECCGFVLADGTVRRGQNIQDELHQLDPRRFPRGARTAYTFAVPDTLFLNASFHTDNPVAIIYHSHPDTVASFSREDSRRALFAGSPLYPVSYLVMSVRKGVPVAAKLYHWDQDKFICTGTFGQSELSGNNVKFGGVNQ